MRKVLKAYTTQVMLDGIGVRRNIARHCIVSKQHNKRLPMAKPSQAKRSQTPLNPLLYATELEMLLILDRIQCSPFFFACVVFVSSSAIIFSSFSFAVRLSVRSAKPIFRSYMQTLYRCSSGKIFKPDGLLP